MYIKWSKRALPIILITYFLVLLIPLLGSIFSYSSYAKILEEEIVSSNVQNITLIREEIDTMISGVEALVNNIATNEYVNKYLGFSQPLTADERYIQAKSIHGQGFGRGQFPLVLDYYIYYKNSNRIVSSSTAMDPELFYKYILSHNDMSYEEWLGFLKNAPALHHEIEPRLMTIQGKTVETFNYIQTLPLTERVSPDAVIVVLLDIEKISELLAKSSMGGYACAIDDAGTIMAEYGDTRLAPAQELLTYERSQSLEINGEKMVVVAQRSNKFNWRFISVIPEDVFLVRINNVRSLMYLTFLISALIGLLAVVFFAYRSYRPIRKIVKSFMRWGDAHTPNMNEYDFIEQSMANVVNRNLLLEKRIIEIAEHDTEIRELVNKNSMLMKHSLLNILLDGNSDDIDSVLSWLSYYDIDFEAQHFLVLLIHIDDYSRFVRDDSKDLQLLKYALVSIGEELANERCYATSSSIENDLVALILNIEAPPPQGDVQAFVSPITSVLTNVFDAYFNVDITVSVGGIQNGIEKLSLSYKQALEVMSYKYTSSGRSAEGIASVDNDKIEFYPVSYEVKLANAIKAGDFALCKEFLSAIFVRQTSQGRFVKKTAFDIVDIISNVLDSIQIDLDDIFRKDFDIVSHLLCTDTPQEMQENILYIFREICTYINNKRKSRTLGLYEQLMAYINVNIHNPDLSQTLIAENLQISSSYLSKFFKKTTGVSMVDYINRKRMQRVKELLTNTDKPLEDIARDVGYTSSKTLIRIFKQFEGITPGKYRETN